jgi:hypothetical protein
METFLLKLSHPRYQLPLEVMVKEDRLHLLLFLPHLLPPQENVHEYEWEKNQEDKAHQKQGAEDRGGIHRRELGSSK